MRYLHGISAVAAIVVAASAAEARDVPLYEPAPAWVVPAALPDSAKLDSNGPLLVLLDIQQRVEGGRLWSYADAATRLSSPEMLAQFATVTLPWLPDKGDLIVHELSIVRDGKRIDILAQGQKLTVLRREESLERRELTGMLTATLPIEGLQVGDIVRMRVSTTLKDDALAGRVQTILPILSAPLKVGYASVRVSWPSAGPAPRWKVLADGVSATPVRKGDFTELAFALPAPKQPDMPADSPGRFRRPPIVELSTFTGWDDVSKVMAPLYSTDGAIAPGSPLAAEVDKIMKAEASPLGRTQRALELVQDKVRYLLVAMDGGNYVPQKPARTWELRYGDCKAKTLLLLALLRAMNIEAEPVLANTEAGDLTPERLPTAMAFNHVLVRASVGGESLWLDGTGLGSRLPDIHDTPPFRWVLPLRTAGAEPMKLETHAPGRPLMDLAVEADESSSPDLPSPFEAVAVLRGQAAAAMTLAGDQVGEKERRAMAASVLQPFVGDAQIAAARIKHDPAAGTVTVTARGVVDSAWTTDDRRRKRSLARALGNDDFQPDRARPAWKAIPVVTADPSSAHYRLRIRLPDGGKGFTIEGTPDVKTHVGGADLVRTTRIEGGVVTLDERMDATGEEIPAAAISAERDRYVTAKANAPRLVAPESVRRQWELSGADSAGGTQVKAVEAALAAAIAADPEATGGYVVRAVFRSSIGDTKGALADFGRAIAIDPSVDLYLERAGLYEGLGDFAAAARDAEAARQLDPASSDAIGYVARLKAERGDLAGALALLDERIALGGDTKAAYRTAKAALVGEYGDAAEAVKLYDALVAEKPGSPSLLNGRCWVKGTRALMLDTALKDCTEAIELSSNTAAALDSRAMVWYRLGKYEQALRDLDALLASTPDQAASRYLRALALGRMGRQAEAAKDLAVARRLSPGIDRTYARFGLKADGPAAAMAAAAAGK